MTEPGSAVTAQSGERGDISSDGLIGGGQHRDPGPHQTPYSLRYGAVERSSLEHVLGAVAEQIPGSRA